jgi:hypothetical protein
MIHHLCESISDNLAGIIQVSLPDLLELCMCCQANSRTPNSPTISAQEGELDNLLSEPTTGWDDDAAPPRYHRRDRMMPQSAGKSEATNIPRVGKRSSKPPGAELRPATWIEGRTLEELEREEAELAKLDPSGPPMDDFGEFEEGKPKADPLGADHASP